MKPSTSSHAHGYRVLLAFACLYVFWGGTYTAARFGVYMVPAPVLAGVRLGISGCLMLLFVGNVGLVWAEYYLPSGLSALLVAIVPVYVAMIELLLPEGERLRMGGQIGLVMGFVGLGILAWPSARTGLNGDRHQILAVGVLLLGAFAFACGSIWSRQTRFSLNLFVCAGWEMLAASFCNVVLATCLGEWGRAHWNRESISVVAYLVIFGSLIGFSSFSWLLQNAPITKIATYAYVNPMVAVLLGALMLGERLQGNEWIGMVIILVAVVLVTSSKIRRGDRGRGMKAETLTSEV